MTLRRLLTILQSVGRAVCLGRFGPLSAVHCVDQFRYDIANTGHRMTSQMTAAVAVAIGNRAACSHSNRDISNNRFVVQIRS